jgi:hypothetical protein
MAHVWHIEIDEFTRHARLVVERVVRDDDTVVIEAKGEALATLQTGPPPVESRRPESEADLQDLMDVAGSWSEVDIDRFLDDIYASR